MQDRAEKAFLPCRTQGPNKLSRRVKSILHPCKHATKTATVISLITTKSDLKCRPSLLYQSNNYKTEKEILQWQLFKRTCAKHLTGKAAERV